MVWTGSNLVAWGGFVTFRPVDAANIVFVSRNDKGFMLEIDDLEQDLEVDERIAYQ